MFHRSDDVKKLVLIEWKYTESYSSKSLAISKNGTDRIKIYQPLLEADDCPIDTQRFVGRFEALFYEPFYQLMRLQLLARAIEKAHWQGVGEVAVLHVAPARNLDFQRVTSNALKPIGNRVIDVWKELVRVQDRFVSVATEALWSRFSTDNFSDLADRIHDGGGLGVAEVA